MAHGHAHAAATPHERRSLTRYAWLSIGAALTTMAIKGGAAALTGSVGLLSDALESVVNLVAAVVALVVLRIAEKPPDEEHAYGHEKAEYFSAGVEGTMILAAAITIAWAAVHRLLHPTELNQLGIGLAISMVAAAINGAVAFVLLRAGKANRSITLEADAHHLFTDVWTSFGVLVGVGLVALTGWQALDPLVGLAVAANIVVSGSVLVRRSVSGLMDRALPPDERAAIDAVLERHRSSEVAFHALRTRQAGRSSFVSVHVLVPGAWTVQEGHDLLEVVETELRTALPHAQVFTHLEPTEDPRSFQHPGH